MRVNFLIEENTVFSECLQKFSIIVAAIYMYIVQLTKKNAIYIFSATIRNFDNQILAKLWHRLELGLRSYYETHNCTFIK